MGVVEQMVRRHEDGLRAELQRLADRHGRLHPVAPRLVAGRGDDAADAPLLEKIVRRVVLGVEKRRHERPLVELHEFLAARGLDVENERVAPAADDDGLADQVGVAGAFGGGEKAVEVEMQYHSEMIGPQKGVPPFSFTVPYASLTERCAEAMRPMPGQCYSETV